MWCDFCKTEVDFNSVGVSNPKRAYSMDIEGDVNPTIITSSNTQVINVCKKCGQSDFMFINQEAVRQQKEAKVKAAEKQEAGYSKLYIYTPIIGLSGGIVAAILNVFETSLIGNLWIGFLIGSFSSWMIGLFLISCLDD